MLTVILGRVSRSSDTSYKARIAVVKGRGTQRHAAKRLPEATWRARGRRNAEGFLIAVAML